MYNDVIADESPNGITLYPVLYGAVLYLHIHITESVMN